MEVLIFITTFFLGFWLSINDEDIFIIKSMFIMHLLMILIFIFFDMLKGVI